MKNKNFLLSFISKSKLFYFDENELQFKRTHGFFTMIVLFFLIIAFVSGGIITKETELEMMNKYSDKEKMLIIKNGDKFSEEKLILFLNELNVPFPEIIYSQARLESGNFSSKLFFENNNIFGMRTVSSRATLQIKTQNGYGVYNSWRQSVVDYVLFSCCYLRDLKTKEQYYDYIEKNYSETVGYSDRVKSIEKEYFKTIKGLTGNSYEIYSKPVVGDSVVKK